MNNNIHRICLILKVGHYKNQKNPMKLYVFVRMRIGTSSSFCCTFSESWLLEPFEHKRNDNVSPDEVVIGNEDVHHDIIIGNNEDVLKEVVIGNEDVSINEFNSESKSTHF